MNSRTARIAATFHLRRPEREALLARLVASLRLDQRVAGVWLSGSTGRGDDDELSDLDLAVVVRDEACAEVVADRHAFVRQVQGLILAQEAPAPHFAPPGGGFLLTLYEGQQGPQEVDWTWRPLSSSLIPPQARLLFGSGGLSESLAVSSAEGQAPYPTIENSVATFWAMAFITGKRIARGQSEQARLSLETTHSLFETVRLEIARFQIGPASTAGAGSGHSEIERLLQLVAHMDALGEALRSVGYQPPQDAALSITQFLKLVRESLS